MKTNEVIKKVMIGFLSVMMSFTFFSVVLSQAKAEETKEANEEDTSVSVKEIQQLDPYVLVENNKFRLAVPETMEIDEKVVREVEKQLQIINEKIITENAVINTEDKSINFNTGIELRLAGLPAHQPDTFWWGARHIFRTKAAADKYAKNLENEGVKMDGGAALAGILGVPIVSGGLKGFAILSKKMASDIRYMKSKYAKIELDIPWTIVGYRVIQWKGK